MTVLFPDCGSELLIWSAFVLIVVVFAVCRLVAYYVQSVQVCSAHAKQLKRQASSSRNRSKLSSQGRSRFTAAGLQTPPSLKVRNTEQCDQALVIATGRIQISRPCQPHSQWPISSFCSLQEDALANELAISSMFFEELPAALSPNGGSHPSLRGPSLVLIQSNMPDPTTIQLTPCLRRRAALNLLLPLIAHGVHYILTPKDDFDKCRSAEAQLLAQVEQHTGLSRQRTGELLALDMNEVFDCLAMDTQSVSPVTTYLANPETLNYSPMLSENRTYSSAVRCAECQSDIEHRIRRRRPSTTSGSDHFEDMLWPVVVAPSSAIPMPAKVCDLYKAVCSVFEMPVGTLAIHFRGVMDELLSEHLFDHLDMKLLSEMGIDTQLELTAAAKEEARKSEMEWECGVDEDNGERPKLWREASSQTVLAAVVV